MSLSTYAELKSSVADWLARTDLDSVIPDFIGNAERAIFHDSRSRIPPLEKKVVLQIDSEGFAGIPSDYLEGITMLCDDVPIQRISLAKLRGYGSQSGKARYFARETYMFKFFPIPDSSYQIELIYYHQPDALSDSNTSNILFAQAPEAYLYGALIEGAKYLGQDESRWQERYQTALNKLTEHARAAEYSGATPVMASGYL